MDRIDAPPTVLLHGFGDSPECWSPLLAAVDEVLDDDGLLVATPAAPGHARELLPPGQALTLPYLAEVAITYIEPIVADAGRPALVGGHSMGAATAVAVAAQRPDLVVGLYLEDPPWSWPPRDEPDLGEPEFTEELREWIAGLQSSSHEDRVQWCLDHNPGWPRDEYDIWARAKAEVDPAVFARPIAIGRHAWRPIATAVRCPVTMLVGDPQRGSSCMPEVADYVEQLGWRVVRFLDAGHDLRRENRPRAIESFLDALRLAARWSA